MTVNTGAQFAMWQKQSMPHYFKPPHTSHIKVCAMFSQFPVFLVVELWEIEFKQTEKKSYRPLTIKFQGLGSKWFVYESIPQQQIILQQRQIGVSLHKVMGNKYKRPKQSSTCTQASYASSLPLSPLVYKDTGFF